MFFNLGSERASIICTLDKGFGQGIEMMGNEIMTSAMLDRLLHHSNVLMIRGESNRLKERHRSGLFKA